MGRHGLVGWAKPIGRHGVPWKTQSTEVWLACSELVTLCRPARYPPRWCANKASICAESLPRTRWLGCQMRAICQTHDIIYQAFSLLSGNRQVLLQPRVTEIADRHNKSVPQVVYRFALQLGMLPLTGTTDGAHMRHNFDIFDLILTRNETGTLLALGGSR